MAFFTLCAGPRPDDKEAPVQLEKPASGGIRPRQAHEQRWTLAVGHDQGREEESVSEDSQKY